MKPLKTREKNSVVMRKAVVIIFAISFLGLISAQSQTEIQVQEKNPGFPAPGDTLEMDVVVSNDGTSGKNYRPLEVDTVEGITYTGTTSSLGEDFSLCGGCQTTGTLYFNVGENAESGSYPIDLKALGDEGDGIVEKTEIEVDGSPNLILNSEAKIMQGETSKSKINIENTGTEKTSQLSATFRHPSISFNSSKIAFGELNPGETKSASLEIGVDQDLDSGPESIEASIEHVENGAKIVENSSISIDILKDVQLAISQIESDAETGSESRVMIELENIGSSQAEEISTNLECENAVVKEGQDFVGSLDAEESVPTVYSVITKSETSDCTLEATYTGESRQTLDESFELNSDSSRPFILYIAGLIVFSGVLLVVRNYRKEE